MAETTADVRRDIEMTRERMSTTLAQIEKKMNLMQIVRDHPWPAIAVAVGAGVLLSGSSADVKAAGATVAATRGASSKIGTVLDDVVANLMVGVSQAFQHRVDSFVDEIKTAIGAPTDGAGSSRGGSKSGESYAAGGWTSGEGLSSRETSAGSGGAGSVGSSGSMGGSGSLGAGGSGATTGAATMHTGGSLGGTSTRMGGGSGGSNLIDR